MAEIDTVNDQMYDLLLHQLLEHKLKPGDKINPKQIAAENHVSVMPVRNALHSLSTQGMVQIHQRSGVYVTKFSPVELCQIGEVRRLFELECCKNAASTIDKTQIMDLYQRIEQTDPFDKHMPGLDDELHCLTVDASGNPFLISQYHNMQNLFLMHIYFEGGTPERSKKQHLEYLSNLYLGNYMEAYAILKVHLDDTIAVFRDMKDSI